MRVLLCGFHEAGCRALRILRERGHDVLVATHASPAHVPSLSQLARDLEVRAVEADGHEVSGLACEFMPDVTFSVYYRHRLPATLLRVAPLGSYNFHPSLLPRHRGSFSAPWAILEGDRETGVTCHYMTEELDAGDIVDQVTIPVLDGDTGRSLYFRLVDAAAALFRRVVERVEHGPLAGRPQTGTPSFHRREVPYDGIINPDWPRDYIGRFIRAFHFPPYAPAGLMINGVRHSIETIEQYDALTAKRATAPVRP